MDKNIILFGFIVIGAIIVVSIVIRTLFYRYIRQYRDTSPDSALSVREFACRVKDEEGIEASLEETDGETAGEFLYEENIVRVPDTGGDSLFALGISAHELAHAGQIKNRPYMTTLAAFSERIGVFLSYLFPIVLIAGFIFYSPLLKVGLILYFLVFLIVLVKIPLELDATVKALNYLTGYGELTEAELDRLKKMLGLAILTRLTDLTAGFIVLVDFNEKR